MKQLFENTNSFIKYVALTLAFVGAAIVSQINYFLNGSSIFHVNSLGAGTLGMLYLFFERVQDLSFMPQLWTDRLMTGTISNPAFSFFNPFFLTTFSFNNFSDALVFYDIQMKVVGGIGLYMLFRHYNLSRISSLLSGCLFVFNGVLVAFAQDAQFIYGMCLIPWALLSIEHIFNKDGYSGSLYFAITLALIFLVSILHTFAWYILCILIPYIIVRLLNPGTQRIRIVFYLFIGALLSFLITLFASFPILHAFRMSLRAEWSGYWYDFLIFSLMISALSSVLYIVFLSNKSIIKIVFKAIVIFSTFAAFEKINSSGFLLTFSNMYTVSIVPDDFVFELQPIRSLFTGLQAFFIILSILYIDKDSSSRRVWHALFGVYGAYMIIMTYWGISQKLGIHEYGVPPKLNRTYFVPLLGVLVLIGNGVDIFATRYLKKLTVSENVRIIFKILLISAILAEGTFVYFKRNMFSDTLKFSVSNSEETRFLKKLKPTERVIDVYENEHIEWLKKMPHDRSALLRYTIPIYHGVNTFSTVGIPIKSKLAMQFHSAAMPFYYAAPRENTTSLLMNMAGVRYIISHYSLSQDGLDRVLSGGDYKIYQNKDAWSRVFLFGGVEYMDEDKILPFLSSASAEQLLNKAYLIKGSKEITLPESESEYKDIVNSKDDIFMSDRGSVEIKEYQSELVEISCNIKKKSILMLTDTFSHGWKGYMNGKEVPIFRVNYSFRGIVVPPGKYQLVMKFEPWYRYPTLLISVITFLSIISLLVRGYYLHKRRKPI